MVNTQSITKSIPSCTLVLKLSHIQAEKRLSDKQFANILGIGRQMWNYTKHNQRKVGLVLLQGAAKAFPNELKDDIWNFLRNGK